MIRAWIREWLGIHDGPTMVEYWMLQDAIRDIAKERDELIKRMDAFTNALKARAQQPARKTITTFDYESSQVAALEEFKEK